MQRPVRVLVVDDSAIARETIRALLEREGDIQVVGEAPDAATALALLGELEVDLATVDLHLPRVAGIELISEIMQLFPVPIVVVTADQDGRLAFEAIDRGALEVTRKPVVFGQDAGQDFRSKVRQLSTTPVIRRPRTARRTRHRLGPAPLSKTAPRDGPLRVVVVDDSPVTRAALKSVLETDGDIQVVGMASDGPEAIRMVEQLQPDLTTMDVVMPRISGLDAVAELTSRQSTRILVVSNLLKSDPRLRERAREVGALDAVAKPVVVDRDQANRLRAHVRALAVERPPRFPVAAPQSLDAGEFVPKRLDVVAIGASAGGPATLCRLLSGLGRTFPVPILVVQHLTERFAQSVAAYLSSQTPFTVELVAERARPRRGVVLLAPPDKHLVLQDLTNARVIEGVPVDGNRPSVTVLLRSVAEAAGPDAAGVILSGMGTDGAAGLLEMRRGGALTFAEHLPAVDGMPRAARELNAVDYNVDLDDIAAGLVACGKLSS